MVRGSEEVELLTQSHVAMVSPVCWKSGVVAVSTAYCCWLASKMMVLSDSETSGVFLIDRSSLGVVSTMGRAIPHGSYFVFLLSSNGHSYGTYRPSVVGVNGKLGSLGSGLTICIIPSINTVH